MFDLKKKEVRTNHRDRTNHKEEEEEKKMLN
jgi:hypothetical protein